MTDSRGKGKSWVKVGCFGVVAVVTVLLIGGAALFGVAALQNRSVEVESRQYEQSLPGALGADSVIESGGAGGDAPAGARLILDVLVAQALIVPAPARAPIRVEASYDPADYELEQESSGDAEAGWIYRIALRPTGSATWALLRAKIGGKIPKMRVAVPRGVAIDLDGTMDRSFVAMELGGLQLRTADLDVKDGGVTVSFAEPLSEPMDSIRVSGSKGALEVTLLGNASPRSAVFEQRFGALDLDLRGAWTRDADVSVATRIAGGSVWLPDDVTLVGLEDRLRLPTRVPETPRPTLTLSLPDTLIPID